MNRLVLLFVLGGATAVVAACDDTRPAQVETAPPPVEAPVAPVTPPPTTAPQTNMGPSSTTDDTTLPPDQRQSEETVKPESETLFY